MNFFEHEHRKFFENDNGFDCVKFVGVVCYGTLGENTRMKLEFVTLGTRLKYEGIKATIMDKVDGEIDSVVLKFKDIWGTKTSEYPRYREGLDPHIWVYMGTPEWYVYEPTEEDYKMISTTVRDYAEIFREQSQEINGGFAINQKM